MRSDEFVTRIAKVKQRGNSWLGCCPAHEDTHPSLSISEGEDGRILLTCHAGCTPEAVCAALGLTLADLFPAKRDEIEAVYAYTDEHGQPLFEVVRFTGKRFAQRTPQGVWSLAGVRRVLFRLPHVLAAIKQGQTIYVCEGEKDVLAAERAGVVATCNPHGAGKWRAEYTETLRGAHVVVIADRDDVGLAHAREVAKGLDASIMLPREGKDLSDHLRAGATLADLVPLAHALPPVLRRYSDITPEHVEWLWPKLIPRQLVTVLAGEQGLGKSMWAVHVAATLSRAGQKTVLVSAEDAPAFVTKPRLLAMQADDTLIAAAEASPVFGNGSDDQWFATVRAWTTWADLIVFDPVMAFLDMNLDSYRSQHVRHLISGLQEVIDETDCALLFLMHLTKAEGTNALKRINGSGAWTEAARSVLLMTPEFTPKEPERILSHWKCNVAEKAEPQRWRIEPILLPEVKGRPINTARMGFVGDASDVDMELLLAPRMVEEVDGKLEEACELIWALLGEGQEIASKELADAFRANDISTATARRARDKVGVRTFQRERKWYLHLSQSQAESGAHPPQVLIGDEHLKTPAQTGKPGSDAHSDAYIREDEHLNPTDLSQSPAEDLPW